MHIRKQIRLQDFDYSSSNAYFITACVKDFRCVFGEVVGGVMVCNDFGKEAAGCLQSMIESRPLYTLVDFVVMPNHVHLLIVIGDKGPQRLEDVKTNAFGKPVAGSVSVFANLWKGRVKTWALKNGRPDFSWQSRFHDHVVRNAAEFRHIREYIQNNPRNWSTDRFFLQ